MSEAIHIREPLGERAALLPLDVGGEGSTLVLPGLQGAVLTVRVQAGAWMVTPAGAASVLLNGMALQGEQSLAEGDVLSLGEAQLVVSPRAARIEVLHLVGNATVAPLRQHSLPGDEVVAGVREIIAADAPAETTSPVSPGTRTRWIAGGIAAALVLALSALLFMLVPVPLQISPAGARVQVAGPFDWESDGRVFLLPGRRTLSISHPGYRDQQLTLQVTRSLASATALPITLEYLPGIIEIDTGGVAAEVLVDGRPAGSAPGEVTMAAGARALVLRAPRYVDQVASLNVAGGGQHQQLKVQLESAVGFLALDTQPASAQIRIDGEPVGEAPQRIELPAGLHQLSLSAPGRRTWSSEVAIIAGQTLDLGRVDLALPPPVAVRAAAAQASSTAPAGSLATAEPTPPALPRAPPAARVQSPLLGALVLLPAGEYLQGSDRREQGRRSNEVQRTVRLTRAFYMGATEVSNAQFRAFRGEHAAGIALEKSLDLDAQAVSNVSWNDAIEFCNWLSLREGLPAAYERRDGRWQLVQPINTGYRLPTEAEWEYAARYVDGQRWQRYPWGDVLPPPAGAANLAGAEIIPPRKGAAATVASLPAYRDEHAVVGPVGSYARSPIGLYDLAGNVSEWMHDVYESLPATGPVSDPMGAAADGAHAIRGANWRSTTIAELRPAWRERGPAGASQTIGFRVVRLAEAAP